MIYTPEEIDFKCFFMSTKSMLGGLVTGLNPYTQRFYKIKDLYVALSYNPNEYNLHIDMMAGKGGLELFEQVRAVAIKCGANTITFVTSDKNEKVNRLAKFYKCSVLMTIEKFYPDGSNGLIYQLDLHK
jgi:hypothetical protein